MNANITISNQNASVVKYSNGEVVLPAHVVETLPKAVKKVIEAKGTPCIADFSQDELETKVAMLLSGLYQDAGQVIDGKDLAVFAYRLCRKLQDMIFLHFGELETACENGLSGLYGQNFGINLVAVLRWIEGYKQSDEHKHYAYEVSKLVDRVGRVTEPTEEQKRLIAKSLSLKTFEDFKDKKDISAPAVTVYDFLNAEKIIVFPPDKKKEFYSQAHENVKKELAHKASRTNNKTERDELKSQIKNVGLFQNGESDQITEAEKTKLLLVNEAKRIALLSFFSDLVEFDCPLEIM